jgi:hypothetical protein
VLIGKAMRTMARRTIQGLAGLPLIGPLIRRYETHYNEASEQESPQKLSERIKGIYDRWSIKLSVEYYEAKDAETATSQASQSHIAQSQAGQSQVAQRHVAQRHVAQNRGAVASPPAARISSTDPR